VEKSQLHKGNVYFATKIPAAIGLAEMK